MWSIRYYKGLTLKDLLIMAYMNILETTSQSSTPALSGTAA